MAKKILVVDDSASMREVISSTLQAEGYDTVQAGDGRDALGKMEGGRFNLIISDVNMPNMDGITFLREVKSMAAHRFTPVVMLTTESQEDRKEQGRAAGAKAWIIKPFQPQQLLAAVQKLMM